MDENRRAPDGIHGLGLSLPQGVLDWLRGPTGCHQLNRVLTAKYDILRETV
jgi:hypothetical protein